MRKNNTRYHWVSNSFPFYIETDEDFRREAQMKSKKIIIPHGTKK